MIDTHCHLHHPGYFDDPDAEVALAREAGVGRIVVIGVDPEDWPVAVAFAERHEGVFAAVGWHPNATAAYDPSRLPELTKWLRHPKVVALGEIGLDYHHDYAPVSIQHMALRDQLAIAEQYGKPVIFHARDAVSDLLDVLERRPTRPYLLHCFTGSAMEARRAARLGAIFGCDGPITYKSADELRRTFGILPLERVVLETDAPYLSPVPHRGKPNRPAYVPLIAQALAEVHGVEVAEVIRITTETAERFFGLGEPRLPAANSNA